MPVGQLVDPEPIAKAVATTLTAVDVLFINQVQMKSEPGYALISSALGQLPLFPE